MTKHSINIVLSFLNINKDLEIKKLIELETNSQLTKFSKIYFDKIKLNYLINEK